MSKREAISRYNLIIKKLRRCPATFAEIADYLIIESDLQAYNFNVSKRTFQRDIEDIRSLYNIDIQFDFSRKVYFIESEQLPDVNERILEAFDTFNALNISDRLSGYILFENRRPQGTENLYGLLHAIKNQVQIKFVYQKFWEDKPTHRQTEPYALKEFQNRWYLLGKDLKDNKVKSFALDRLTDLEISKQKFSGEINFDVNKHYEHCFGIIGPNTANPEEIILSFDPCQGKYIKSLPLHHSQQVIIDNDDELRIKLTLFITEDFVMEVMSHSYSVKVLQPKSLIDIIKQNGQKVLAHY